MTYGEAYPEDFFDTISKGSVRSAGRTMPKVLRLIGSVGSVVDVGCGSGAWGRAAGAKRFVGVDGEWARESFGRAGPGEFVAADVSKRLPDIGRFDLVISLEVAEHLYARHADTFIGNLTRLGDVILFSAALPGQGGTHHVNEKWPSYWFKKFERRGFRCLDIVRPQIRHDRYIEPWYRQNVLIYATDERAAQLGPTTVPQPKPIFPWIKVPR